MSESKKWWKEAVAYQIYPRSFMDSNGDGVGDLPGITSKLDYLKDLGVDVIWLCPMYKSPQDDNGYDISDYQDIHHEYGTLKDFDHLLKEAHRRGMKVIIDLVVNHTSDEHAWFMESRSSQNNPKRDWYIWRDGKNGAEPNNWESIFGGSAWQYDEGSRQYYMHLFSTKQPDLNWDNLKMREAIYSMIRWWIKKGVDGFRLDAISHMMKEPGLADMPNPRNLRYVPSYAKHMNVPGVLDYIDGICQKGFGDADIMTVGEANGVSASESLAWVDESEKKLNMLFQFEHLDLWSTNPEKRIDLPKVKTVFTKWQNTLEGRGWNALYLENHDIPRIISKWGDADKYWRESATCLATLYFLMKGTPFIYQGQEIGMTNTVFNGPQDFDDVRARNMYAINREKGISDSQTTAELAPVSRDNSRTPMQWSSDEQAGFTTGRPWLKVNPNYVEINVEDQQGKRDSVLGFYKSLVTLRKSDSVFVYGRYDLILENHPQIYGYTRTEGGKKTFVLCNLSDKTVNFTGVDVSSDARVLGNYKDSGNPGSLRPFEAQVYLQKN